MTLQLQQAVHLFHEHEANNFQNQLSNTISPVYKITISFSYIVSITSIGSGILMLIIIHQMQNRPVPQLRPGSRHLLRALTVADIFRAIITLMGVIRFSSLESWLMSPDTNLNKVECDSSPLCLALAVFNQWSNLSAYFWTLSIGIYFWFTAFRRHRRLKRKSMDGIFTTFHCICWFVPILPPVFAFTFGRLGDNFNRLTWTGLCGVSSCGANCTKYSEDNCTSKEIVDISVAATSKLWEVCITFIIFGIYVHSKMDLWRLNRRARVQMKAIDSLSTRPRRRVRQYGQFGQRPSTSNRSIADPRILSISADLQSIDLTTPTSSDVDSVDRRALSPPHVDVRERRLTDSTERALAKKTQLTELKEEHLFYLLIILLYLGRVWGTIRYLLSLIFRVSPYPHAVETISDILLVIQSLGDCSQATFNLVVFLVHCSQAREICYEMFNTMKEKFAVRHTGHDLLEET